jgi:hypothetical protein
MTHVAKIMKRSATPLARTMAVTTTILEGEFRSVKLASALEIVSSTTIAAKTWRRSVQRWRDVKSTGATVAMMRESLANAHPIARHATHVAKTMRKNVTPLARTMGVAVAFRGKPVHVQQIVGKAIIAVRISKKFAPIWFLARHTVVLVM